MSRHDKLRSARGFGSSSGAGFGAFQTRSSLSYLFEPPAFSTISDANVVVALKSLLKKDATTKAKALEDLISYAQAHPFETGGTEDAVLDAWMGLYARASIDNSRRVRELSHTLQLELTRSARKRMERRIPLIIGPWLAGSFDKDRGVARAATEGLKSLFNNEEKMKLVWTKCHAQMLDFAVEAVKETSDTLSDERSTTKEDAQAKYYRVMGAGLALVLNLLERVDLERIHDGLEAFLGVNTVWALAGAEDAFVRRTLYSLIQICLDKAPDLLESRLAQIGKVLVADSLKSSQLGSAENLVKVLTSLTKRFPEVWKTKNPPLDRLRPFVERGSQGSSWGYWQELDSFLAVLPTDKMTTESATLFLKALRTGISSREEHRDNKVYAWACYINSFERISARLPPDVEFVQKNIYPLTDHFIHPTAATPTWICTEPKLFPKAWDVVARQDSEMQKSVGIEWDRLADAFISRMSNSLPELSSDFQKSQEDIRAEGERWFTLASVILSYRKEHAAQSDEVQKLKDVVTSASFKVLRGASDLLLTRNYKPFGSAAIIQSALTKCPDIFQYSNEDVIASVFPTTDTDAVNTILSSPASPYLLSGVDALATIPGRSAQYEKIWTLLVDVSLAKLPSSSESLTLLLSTPSATNLARQHSILQTALADTCTKCAEGTCDAWAIFEAALAYNIFAEEQFKRVVGSLLQTLDDPAKSQTALRALETVLQRQPTILSDDHQMHLDLVTKLLALSEISDKTLSTKATALQQLLDQHSNGELPLVKIVRDNLESAGPLSLGIDTLKKQALDGTEANVPLEDLLPSSNVWMTEISAFFQQAPNPSLSLTSNLGGAYFLVDRIETPTAKKAKRDRKGRSIPARMALYMSKLVLSGVDFDSLPQQFRIELLYALYLTVELAADELTMNEPDGLWVISRETAEDVKKFVSSSRHFLNYIVEDIEDWKHSTMNGDTLVEGLIAVMLRQCEGSGALALYSAKALSHLLQAITETHGLPSDIDARISNLVVNKPTPAKAFPAVALLTGFGEALGSSKAVNNLCNKLVSNIVGALPLLKETLNSMVLVNAVLAVYEAGQLPVDKRRLAIALQNMTSWMDTPDEMSDSLAAETCKGLQLLVHNVKGIYGPYWEKSIRYCTGLWSRAGDSPQLPASRLPYLFWSIKLIMALENLEGANDDLVEALQTNESAIPDGLIALLNLPHEDTSQPLELVDSLLCRRISRIPVDKIKNLDGTYELVASNSREVQTAAFGLIHKQIPACQEARSLDAVLDKKQERLPDELLSLLLDAPTLEAYPDDALAQFPTTIRGYLLAWHLIFDVLDASAHKLRGDYVEHLKADKVVDPLLEFIFDVLGHSAGSPISFEKENFREEHIRNYDIPLADAEPPERSMQWLMIHLYYKVLKHLPGLFKTWYLDCRSKQTKIAIESWTTKHFSPVIISDTLDAVSTWGSQQDPPDEGEVELHVRIGRNAREVIAGYEVDELEAAIAIRIPPSYPIDNIVVEGKQRVACSEKRWHAWLMATQGVIVFSGGSIADGLATFRRNVNGALKGQTECAICYSIVSSDKRMPDKKCGTCKNAFHRLCLYKWFQTSNQNSCPLCRNPIDYIGADQRTSRRRGLE